MEDSTRGVDTILGDPKRAIRRLAGPMTLAMVAQALYNLFDAIWVAGLGSDALAAVGLVFPLFFIILGVGNGLGIGAASSIARRIGSGDKAGADSAATHAFVLAIIAALVFTGPLVFFAEDLFLLMGAGEVTPLCVQYGQVMFGGSIIIFLVTVMDNILRSEGDAKRSMKMMLLASGLNIVLDPIFIYTLGMGVAGAAWASLLAFAIAAMVMMYWFLVKKDTYIHFKFQGFRLQPHIVKDITRVGIPAATEMAIISISALFINMIILSLGSTDGVAVFSSGWRVFQMAMIPVFGIGGAVVPVCGAAFGGRRYRKLGEGYRYAAFLASGVMLVLAVILVLFASDITVLFTYSDGTAYLRDDLISFVSIGSIFLPFIGLGGVSSMMFQAIGRGVRSLISTLLRNIVFCLPPVYFLGQAMGLQGIWWGVVIGEVLGSSLVFAWGTWTVLVLLRESPMVEPSDA